MHRLLVLVLAGCTATDAAPAAADLARAARVVDCNGGADHTTIGEAIALASDGDVIEVAPCTYAERIDFGGKTVTVRARSGPSDTILDGGAGGTVVTAKNGEGPGTALIGFTITNGRQTKGAAVVVDLAKLRLQDVVITGNAGESIVYGFAGDIELRNVRIDENRIEPAGGAIVTFRGGVNAREIEVDCNDGGHGVWIGHGAALIDWSSIACPAGKAVVWEHATGRVQRTRMVGQLDIENEDDRPDDGAIVENALLLGGGGVEVTAGSAIFRNSVITGTLDLRAVENVVLEANVFTEAACAITADVATAPFVPVHSDFWRVGEPSCQGAAWVGANGNFSADPLFTDPAGEDYSLRPGSPCVDAGLVEEKFADPDGTRNDVGAYGGPKSLGGGW